MLTRERSWEHELDLGSGHMRERITCGNRACACSFRHARIYRALRLRLAFAMVVALRPKKARRKKLRLRRKPAVLRGLADQAARELASMMNLMIAFNAPVSWCRFAFLLATSRKLNLGRACDHVEYFAGQMAVTECLREAGLRCVAYEVLRDPCMMDFMSPCGFVNACALLLRVRAGGGMLAAPVCSTWVYMNRGTSKRTAANPHGDAGVSQVQQANCMVARVCLLCYLAAARGIAFILEQPAGSLLEKHDSVQAMLKQFDILRKHVQMKDFGASTPKPTWLYSNEGFLDEIDTYVAKAPIERRLDMVKVSTNSEGRRIVSGGSDLKKSQAYPRGFGLAVRRLHAKHAAYLRRKAEGMLELGLSLPALLWQPSADLAELGKCIEILEAT